jgi:hypothetical protein
MDNNSRAIIELKNGEKISLNSVLFENDEDINLDELFRIDIKNLVHEIVTFPIVLNQLGLLLAEANSQLSEKKLDLEIYVAKRKEFFRKRAMNDDDTEDEEGLNKKAKPSRPKKLSVDEIDSLVTLDPGYAVKKRKLIEIQKQVDYVTSIFWSGKSKDEKLNKMSLTLKEGDIYDSLVNNNINRINYVTIRNVRTK